MKFKLFIALLVKLGFPQAQIDQLVSEEGKEEKDQKLDVATFVNEFREKQKLLFENDADFVGKFTNAEKAKQQDIYLRQMKKTFGLKAEQVKDKTLDEVIELAKETYVVDNKDLATLQKENVELNTKIQEYETVIIPKVKGEVETEKKVLVTKGMITKKLLAKKLRVPLTAVEPAINAALEAGYELFVNDKNELDYFVKGTKLKEKNKDGSNILTVDQIMDSRLDEWQFLEKSNAQETTKTKTDIQPEKPEGDGKPKYYNPHLKAAQENLDKIKAAAEVKE